MKNVCQFAWSLSHLIFDFLCMHTWQAPLKFSAPWETFISCCARVAPVFWFSGFGEAASVAAQQQITLSNKITMAKLCLFSHSSHIVGLGRSSAAGISIAGTVSGAWNGLFSFFVFLRKGNLVGIFRAYCLKLLYAKAEGTKCPSPSLSLHHFLLLYTAFLLLYLFAHTHLDQSMLPLTKRSAAALYLCSWVPPTRERGCSVSDDLAVDQVNEEKSEQARTCYVPWSDVPHSYT